MSIQSKIDEVHSIKVELTSLNKKSGILRKRVKILEADICKYMESKNQEGFKYNGLAVIKETNIKNTLKPKKQQEKDMIGVLKKYTNNPTGLLKEIQDSKKGEPKTNNVLKLKNL
jgi:hypothetical protein